MHGDMQTLVITYPVQTLQNIISELDLRGLRTNFYGRYNKSENVH